MEIKDKVNYVAHGVMGYTAAMIETHHVDEVELLKKIRKLLKERIELIENDQLWKELFK